MSIEPEFYPKAKVSFYPEVETFADLPLAASHPNKIYIVRVSTGIILINRKSSGLYRSSGIGWNKLGSLADLEAHMNDKDNPHSVTSAQVGEAGGYLTSIPPSGKHKIENVYFDVLEDEYVIIHSTNPEP